MVRWWVTGQVSVDTEWKAAVTVETIVIMKLHTPAKNQLRNQVTSMASASPELGPAELLLVSGAGACVCQSLVAPLERVKLVRQGQGELARRGLAAPYTGAAHCAASLLRTEGVTALWRGNLASLLRIFPSMALSLGLRDKIRDLLKPSNDAPRSLKVGLNLASGGLAGVLSLLLVYPLDYARTRLATDIKDGAGGRQFRGLLDVYVKTVKADGVQGLYRGLLVAGLGIFLHRGLYFGLYATLQPAVVGGAAGVARLARTFLLGWAVTLAAGLLVYPLDTVRTRHVGDV